MVALRRRDKVGYVLSDGMGSGRRVLVIVVMRRLLVKYL